MTFKEHTLYHIYNRSINKEVLFKSHEDYLKFLAMIRKHLSENCEILCWCLMPNHFHLLVNTTTKSVEVHKVGGLQLQVLQNAIKNLLSCTANLIIIFIPEPEIYFSKKQKLKKF